jgi:Radical SAM superfamily
MERLRVVLIKPSKYRSDGTVERFRTGFMPNATLYHIASLTPRAVSGRAVEIHNVDEYVRQDLGYLQLLHRQPGTTTLVALVGVQSHQFHRALDLAAYARAHGVRHCVIGGPHPMTCDTRSLHNRGVAFALAEAEVIWEDILLDAVAGELDSVYGDGQRWADALPGVVIDPPSPEDLARYWAPMLGLYPVRGCLYQCKYCSVIKIAGHRVRSPHVESTLESLRRAKNAGIRMVMFVSDNFNKFPEVRQLLEEMIRQDLRLSFHCQCDTQIVRDPALIELMGRAGCYEMYLGVESVSRDTLRAARKFHNDPARYEELVRMCRGAGIRAHFSNMIGFPDQDERAIRSHIDALKQLRPPIVSFYILTPIPGTDQYREFRSAGLIHERNLDRFDAAHATWEHPKLAGAELERLLYRCYVDYCDFLLKDGGLSVKDRRDVGFIRYMAAHGMHPMSGGIGRIVLDRAADYSALRQDLYGIDLVPLPDNLQLSHRDEMLDRRRSGG